ncbi:Rap1a/Tai family immunity protein [Rhodovastum atsumiense]|uniref:Rap1a immunity protein domain-containing protein n=1 Tax=Rhodovastum atsumiense TaxID=504468 RepID=A0A5M6ILE9_9PROT|nr:Rap1a/Tai family immunity protein [Rhodovastum atsumiense]KAA5608992.1 hypothetical protein F1189_26285 [Rhodovastum atsumiense]
MLAILLPWGARAAVSPENFQLRNAGDLAALCASDPADPSAVAAIHFCHGFAEGAYAVLKIEQDANPRLRLFCMPPAPPSRNAAIGGFVAWVKADPARAALAPADGLAGYLSQAYPCPPTAATNTRRK